MELNKNKKDIIAMRILHNNWSMPQIARNVGCCSDTVKYHLRRNNLLTGFPMSPPLKLDIDIRTLKTLYYGQEMTLQQIGNIYDVSRERVRQVMERKGLKRRQVGKFTFIRPSVV